jgi:hypothetical protein
MSGKEELPETITKPQHPIGFLQFRPEDLMITAWSQMGYNSWLGEAARHHLH